MSIKARRQMYMERLGRQHLGREYGLEDDAYYTPKVEVIIPHLGEDDEERQERMARGKRWLIGLGLIVAVVAFVGAQTE